VVRCRAQHSASLSEDILEKTEMPEVTVIPPNVWNVLLVEDDNTVRRQICEYLSEESLAFGKLHITEISDLNQALNLVHEHKADLVILDVYRGVARPGGEQIGIRILERIKSSGFVAVIIYTALPEGLEALQSSFVRLVGKEAGGLARLKAEVTDLFLIRVPQVHRAIINHLDRALCAYMWEFVQGHWEEFSLLIDKPEFLRLIVQRLARVLTREGISQMAEEVYGTLTADTTTPIDTVHPAEYYIKPPIGQDPMLGDIRLRESADTPQYLIVLWPTCDMVSARAGGPKTDYVLCARATLVTESPEVRDWKDDVSSNTKKKKVERLIKNTRDDSPDRYHYLPGVWDIPHLVVDFQALEYIALKDVRTFSCVATMASPFAEALGVRFQRYIGRLGTPDLDVDCVLTQLKPQS
jgi:CheY-like chemotaxis protein